MRRLVLLAVFVLFVGGVGGVADPAGARPKHAAKPHAKKHVAKKKAHKKAPKKTHKKKKHKQTPPFVPPVGTTVPSKPPVVTPAPGPAPAPTPTPSPAPAPSPSSGPSPSPGSGGGSSPAPRHRVLLLSVDGLHQSDLAAWVAARPDGALAALTGRAANYVSAQGSFPSDSFPGLLALVTGGTPKSTGVYYDHSFDRSLYPAGSNCTGPIGAEVTYDESIDKNLHALDGGGGIDSTRLPLAKSGTACTPVMPHEFLRVNTIFNVAHDAGLRTAWADKHRAYDLVNGHQGGGVDDLFTPEIASNPDGSGTAGTGTDYTSSEPTVQQYDDIKVQALLNEIKGKDHAGTASPGVPSIFGMNFQAVSVGQKLPASGFAFDPNGCPGATACPFIGGYDRGGAFTGGMISALSFVDTELGRLVAALQAQGLAGSTEIVLTAKHGQSPTDPSTLTRVDPAKIESDITSSTGTKADGSDSLYTNDDNSLVWLTSSKQSTTDQLAAQFRTDAAALDLNNPPSSPIDGVIAGPTLKGLFGDPASDPRVPDVVLQPKPGGLYSLSKKKVAEHGGGTAADRAVALVVYDPQRSAATIAAPVQTTAVASTILRFLGLDPNKLQSVQQEGTTALPTP